MTQSHSDLGRQRQRELYLTGAGGQRPVVPVAWPKLEAAAEAAMSPEAWAYVAGGAGRESTVEANRAAFERWRIVPRVLRGAESRDLAIELFGRKLPSPLLLSPIGVLELAHPEADLAVARAAAATRVPYIFSNQASVRMEDCAAAMGDVPHWFQLYWSRSNELVASFVRRAEACGCSAIVLTLDTTMMGWRPRDFDVGPLPFLQGKGLAQYTSDPIFRAQIAQPLDSSELLVPSSENMQPGTRNSELEPPARSQDGGASDLSPSEKQAAVQRFLATFSRPSLRWDDLKFLRQHTKLPILLKGVLHPDDARKAIELGLDGLVVSNHGGRQIDGAIASLDALPAIVDAVNGKIPVLFDSGIRGGADVFKALALGATAVGLGRPYCYGLAVAGQRGVEEVVGSVLAEFDLTLGLAGCASVREVTREAIVKA